MNNYLTFDSVDEFLDMLDEAMDIGAEVHIVDKSNPSRVVEHIFTSAAAEDEADDLPFDDPCCDQDDCESCGMCFLDDDGDDFEPSCWGIPDIDRVIFSGRATIVFWTDGTKTVVKCMEGEKVERYAGFAAACMKKMFGSTSRAKAVMEECATEQIIPEKKSKEIAVPDMTEAFVVQQNAHAEAIQEAVNEALG